MQISYGDWVAEVDERKGSEGLTPREALYLEHVASGMTFKEVARATGRSPETVAKAMKRAYHRLGVSRATAAVAKAQALGWIRYIGSQVMCLLLAVALSMGADDGFRRGARTPRVQRREQEIVIYA